MRSARITNIDDVANSGYSSQYLTTLLSYIFQVSPLNGFDQLGKLDPNLLECIFNQKILSKAQIKTGSALLKRRVQKYLSKNQLETTHGTRSIATQFDSPSPEPCKQSIGIQCDELEKVSTSVSDYSVMKGGKIQSSSNPPKLIQKHVVSDVILSKQLKDCNRSALETLYDMDLL